MSVTTVAPANERPTASFWFAGFGVLFALLYVVGALGPLESYAFAVAGVAMLAAMVFAIRRYKPKPVWPWLCIVATVVLFLVAGSLRVDFGTLGNLSATRSLIPDALAIPGYLLLGAGLCRFAAVSGGLRNPANLDTLLEGLVAALAVFACAWVFMINPVLFHHDTPWAVRIMLSCYPPLSVFLAFLAFRISFDPSRRGLVAGKFLMAAFLFMLVGDTVYMFQDIGVISVPTSVIELPYLLTILAFGANVLHPSMTGLAVRTPSAQQAPSMGRLALVAIALVIPAAIAVDTQEGATADKIASAIIVLALTCAVSVRLFRALRSSARATTEMERRATHDPLTGLPNRRLIQSYVNAKLRGAESNVALLFLDVDRFKDVNDSMGHTFGDELLTTIAERLSRTLRDGDIVGRIGGDEFVVVLAGSVTLDEALVVAERIRACFQEPFAVRQSKTHVFASVGVAFAERNDNTMTDAEILIADADNAMYRAKQEGRNTVAVFDASMREAVAARRSIEDDLQDALANGELTLDYQPIVELDTGAVSGFEALLRWSRSPDELVPPVVFIPIAEQTGLIKEIGAWVVEEACHQLAEWRATIPGASDLFVSVNVSATQLRDPADLTRTVTHALLSNGLAGTALALELTETILMDNLAVSLEVLTELRGLGVQLAIDDFGTGYSSLAYLKRLPVHSVKIDQTFIRDLENDDTSEETIVAAIVAMAHALGIKTVAEGVETSVQEARLRNLECDVAQGYLYSHPVHAHEVAPLFEGLRAQRLRLIKNADRPAS
jgi:diguanylate cyclase